MMNSLTKVKNRAGQATSEFVVLVPLLLLLGGCGIAVVYMAWQGIKVQQAANVGARIFGQEKINGGYGPEDLKNTNGLDANGLPTGGIAADADLSRPNIRALAGSTTGQAQLDQLDQTHSAPLAGSVYRRYYDVIHKMFNNPSQGLFVPPPVDTQDKQISEEIHVQRLMRPPSIMGFKLHDVIVDGKAYGGEDPWMYGLPRYGHTSQANSNNGPNDHKEWENWFQ